MRKELQVGDQNLSVPAFSSGYSTSYRFNLSSVRLHINKENKFGTA